ncbi:hypothetical protein K466DRAFT_592344 [Polyporus arcularius HHB13444]|uniref:Uncharacterized protein n=1 Tax=Polyporus arcularius HHB13444 TaxID=1314778 RepID=A0A5C3NQE9_9APHY|nr:hypothetical protein K466DRAFT_592344 [Polyporus arcularius HHB13444]
MRCCPDCPATACPASLTRPSPPTPHSLWTTHARSALTASSVLSRPLAIRLGRTALQRPVHGGCTRLGESAH